MIALLQPLQTAAESAERLKEGLRATPHNLQEVLADLADRFFHHLPGALTGIVGVNRDPAGTGLGCELLFNTDAFCFGPLDHDQPLPPGLHHPRRLYEGVRQGVEDGGNQSGIPTVNGALFFDNSYLGRPLVFCGTGALMEVETNGQPTHLKEIHPGDYIVMAGGRVGKDGIHGATFSSQALAGEAPVGVVQIVGPLMQKPTSELL